MAGVIVALATCGTIAGCKRSGHPRATSYHPPSLPAGFVDHAGGGWRIAVPSTWKDASQKGPAVYAVVDPQAVDDFHAYANVVTEPFAGESDEYAKANEAGLRRDPRPHVESAREDLVDGDSTVILESRWAPGGALPTYQTMQASLASRGIGYVVTCAASANAFARYRSTCESVVRSFAVER
jgi:hypothetical protein